MPELFIPLVGSYNKRSLAEYAKDNRFINVIHEVAQNPVTGKTTVYVRRRPGMAISQTDATGIGGPMHVWSGLNNEIVTARFEVAGPNKVHVYVSNALVTGGTVSPFDGGCISITETSVSGTPTLIFIMLHGTTRSYYYYQSGGTLTLISDADFPANTVGEPAFKDGYMFVMDDDGKVYNSDLNSVSSWTAGNYISTDAILDKGTGVVAHKNYIMAFGEKGCEPLYNAGNASGSPLSRVQGGAFGAGKEAETIAGHRAHCSFEDLLYWNDGIGTVWTLNGGQPQRVDTIGLNMAGVSQGFQGAFRFMGKLFIAIRAANTIDGITMLYSPEDGTWTEFAPQWVSSSVRPNEFGLNTGNGGVYFTDNNSASVWLWKDMSTGVYQDNSVAYTSTIQTSNIDFGNGRSVTFNKVEIVSDVRGTSGNTSISWTDNDYTSFSTARSVDLSTSRPRLLRCGSSRTGRRAFKITDDISDTYRIEGLRVFYTVNAV